MFEVVKFSSSFQLLLLLSVCYAIKIDVKELKCLVCEASIDEIKNSLKSIDPSIKVDIGGYHLDADGNYKPKAIPKVKSELHLSEVLDEICDKMENYIRATWKTTGKLTLLNLLDSRGNMNAKMSEVDIIQDDDLNKSLKYYCQSIVEESEDSLIQYLQRDEADLFCSSEIDLCPVIKRKKQEL